MSNDLVAETRRKLRAATAPKTAIADEAGVSLRWLYMFENGEITNPTLRTIQSLRSYLDRATENVSS